MHTPATIPPEQRTWEPSDVKIDPITSLRPSNRQLAEQGNQLHRCLESHKTDTSREFKHLKRDVKDLKDALGVGETRKKTVATQTPRAAFLRTFMAAMGAITATGVAVRLFEVLWPYAKPVAAAVLHAFMTGKL